MTITVDAIGTEVRGTNTILTPVAPQDNVGQSLLYFTGEFAGSQNPATPGSWTMFTRNVNTTVVKCWGIDATGSTSIPGVTWGTGSIAWAILVSISGVAPIASALDVQNDRQSSTSNIVGPASILTPTQDQEVFFFVGTKNKSTASNGVTFSPPANFTMLYQSVPNGNNVAAFCIAYWIQTTATAVPANQAFTGSIADVQTGGGSIFSLKAASVIVPIPPLNRGGMNVQICQ
jgi:hypothetical protein